MIHLTHVNFWLINLIHTLTLQRRLLSLKLVHLFKNMVKIFISKGINNSLELNTPPRTCPETLLEV